MAHTKTETKTGTGTMTPPRGQGCAWVERVLRFVRGGSWKKCEDNKWVEYQEHITHKVTPNKDGTCSIEITTVTTITYTDDPCGIDA